MKKRDWINLLIIVLLIAFSYYRYNQKIYHIKNSQILMDTQVDISVSSKNKHIDKSLDKAFNIIRNYDEKLSYYNADGELHSINNNPLDSVNIDKSFFDILTIAKEIYTESNGLYDVSIAELINLWNMGEKSIPNDEQLAQAIKKSGFNKVKISPTVLYRPHGLEINLGSISKGYIVDKTMDYLIKQGVEEAYINAGGDLKIYSKNNKKTRIGIQHPRIATDVIATLEVSNMAVVTSGDYERFFEIDGVRYHHILNPKTGYPAQNTISVTVISKTAVLADALSTALFVMSPEDGIRLIKKYPDTEAIIYYKSGDDLISLKTEGIKKYLISEIDFVKK